MLTRILPPHNSSRGFRAKLLAGTAASLAILSGPIHGVTYSWDKGGGDFLWGNAANWAVDGIPIAGDTINLSNTGAGIFGDISLGNVERSVSIINFNGNTSDRYRFVAGGDLALGFLSGVTQINQTADDPSEVQVRVRAGNGTGILSTDVTSNTLGLQQQITSGGLTKTGGSTLRLGTSGTAFENAINGPILLNGGTLTASAGAVAGVNNPLGGTGVGSTEIIIGAFGTTLNLQSQLADNNAVYDFQRNVQFGNFGGTINVQASTGDPGDPTNRIGNLTLGNATLTLGSSQGYKFAASNLILTGTASTLAVSATSTLDALTISAGGTLNKTGTGTLTLSGNNSTTSAGAIKVLNGTLRGTSPGAFGTGLVTVGDTTLNSAGFLPNSSRVNIGAVGVSAIASGAGVIAVAGGAIDLDVVPGAGDIFEVRADGRIQGTASQFAGLTVGSNLLLSPNAIIVHDEPGAGTGTVQGLTNSANLFYGIAATANTLPTIGAGTPWKGISGDTTGRTIQGVDAANPAIININGGDSNPDTIEATFQGMFNANLTFNTDYAFASTVPGKKITLGIRGTLGSGFSNIPGALVLLNGSAAATGLADHVDKIVVMSGGLSLTNVGALGGVPVEVQNNGVLDIGNTAGNVIDGPVTFKSGGMFVFNDNQMLKGTGQLTFESGSKLSLTDNAPATFFTDATQPMTFAGDKYTVRFSASNIAQLDARIPDAGAIYVVSGGATAATIPETNVSATMNTQTEGLTLVNGTLTNDTNHRAFAGDLRLNNSDLTVAATRGTTFVVTSGIATTGNLQIGSLTPIDGRDKNLNSGALNASGMPDPYNNETRVIFTGAFSAKDVTANQTHLAFSNANTTITGGLTVNGSVLYLDGGGPITGGQGDLTGKLAAGTLASSITLGNYSRAEVKLNLASDSNATVLQINTPFIMEGDVNPQDNRRFWLSRQSGTNNRVDLTNVTLKAGSAFAIQEDNTDVRAAIKLAGNASLFRGGHQDFDFLSLKRDASAENPTVVATLGRVNIPGIQGFNNTVSKMFGELGEGVQVDIIRGQLFFVPGSTVNGVVRTQVAEVGGDSFVVSTSDNGSNTFTTDTTIGGTGRIELGRSAAANGPEDFEIRGTEVTNAAAAQAPLHTHSGEIRVIDDGTSAIDGVIRSNRVNDSDRTARVRVEKVVLTLGSTVQLASSNNIPLVVGNIRLDGSATIDTAAADMTIETVTAGAHTVSFTGSTAPTVLNALSAGEVHSARANFNGAVSAATKVNVSGGTTNFLGKVTSPLVSVNAGTAVFSGEVASPAIVLDNGAASFASNVTGNMTVKSSIATLNPGFGNSQTISGPVNLDLGILRVASGTVDLGANAIISNTAQMTFVAGLREMLVTNAGFDETTPNTSPSVKLGPVMAQSTTGWGLNETYVYTGEFFVPNNNGDGTGTFAFAENFDDNVRLDIDGVQRLRNTTWNDATGTGALTLASGWHKIEMRFGQATGGAGPNNNDGWNTTLGFGVDLTLPVDSSTTSPAIANFVAPLDNGSMNLFRTGVRTEVTIAADATLKASRMSEVGALVYTGTAGLVELNGAQPSNAGAISVSNGGTGRLALLNGAATTTVANLDLNGDFIKSGPGTLIITDAGSGTGSVTVKNGTLGGGGSIAGMLIAEGGVISPGLGAGRLTVGGLNLHEEAVLRIELNGSTAGTGYDQIFLPDTNLGGVTLAGSLEATLGFIPTAGDVFLIILNSGSSAFTGTFSNVTADLGTILVSGVPFTIDYAYNGNGDGVFNDVALIAQVPEPTSMLALLSGFGMLAGLQRFRRTSRRA